MGRSAAHISILLLLWDDRIISAIPFHLWPRCSTNVGGPKRVYRSMRLSTSCTCKTKKFYGRRETYRLDCSQRRNSTHRTNHASPRTKSKQSCFRSAQCSPRREAKGERVGDFVSLRQSSTHKVRHQQQPPRSPRKRNYNLREKQGTQQKTAASPAVPLSTLSCLGDVVALGHDADNPLVGVGHGQGPDVVGSKALHGLVDGGILRDAEVDLEVT